MTIFINLSDSLPPSHFFLFSATSNRRTVTNDSYLSRKSHTKWTVSKSATGQLKISLLQTHRDPLTQPAVGRGCLTIGCWVSIASSGTPMLRRKIFPRISNRPPQLNLSVCWMTSSGSGSGVKIWPSASKVTRVFYCTTHLPIRVLLAGRRGLLGHSSTI